MSKFKVGDRVRCIRGCHVMTPRTGWTGTVRECGEYRLIADWDGHGRRTDGADMCEVGMVELIEPSTNIEARVAALEKLVGITKAPEYSFGDRVEVLVDGEWVEGLIAAPKDGNDGRWCEYLDDGATDGASGGWFKNEEIRPRK